MNAAPSLEFILRRDRVILIAGLAGLTLVSWGYMVHEARGMQLTGVCCCLGMKMSGPDTSAWSVSTLLPLFLMWTEMMVAMMLPTVAPMVLTFALVNRKRREQERPFVPTAVFLAGYMTVWAAFSAVLALAQWALHGAALLSPLMSSTSAWLAGGLLIAAGLFQFTHWKHACLAHCRSPLEFLMTGWREGRRGAFEMGVKHGAYCTGCCWVLMALLFVLGVMNVLWIAAITALVLIEKAVPRGEWWGRIAGVVFIAWGGWMFTR
jgi:predicted metal-binding membrane protein